MKKFIRFSAVIISFLFFIQVSFAADASYTKSATASQSTYVYTIKANNGVITRTGSNEYRLTFKNANKPIYISVANSKTAKRDYGRMTVAAFVKDWSKGANSFAKNPPNADLHVNLDSSSDKQNFVFKISNPTLSKDDNTLTFNAVPINGKCFPGKDRACLSGSRTLEGMNAFIDNFAF